jgi:hypothetical protein
MSKHRVLSLKPQLRLEWRGQDGQNETEQPDHSAGLGDSITASTPIRFSVHTATIGRPPRRRDFHRQYDLNPARCHLTTVSGFTIAKAPSTIGAKRYKPANIRRSSIPNVGLFGDFRCNTLS